MSVALSYHGDAHYLGGALYRHPGCGRAGLAAVLFSRGPEYFRAAMQRIGSWSIAALLLTLVLLFAFQGEEILQQPRVIALLAVLILIQVLLNSGLACLLNRAVGESHRRRLPFSADRRLEFLRARGSRDHQPVWISVRCGPGNRRRRAYRGAGVLLVVRIVNQSKGWYEHKGALREAKA